MKNKAGKSKDRTNAMRILDAKGAAYVPLTVPVPMAGGDGGPVAVSAVEAAALLGRDPDTLFKTLVTVGKSREHYVFVIPGSKELDLRKAAKAVNEKSIEMVHSKELLPLTGYVHGGCSPVGMKRPFTTVLDASAQSLEKIIISAGRIGLQMEIAPAELGRAVAFTCADLTEN